MKHKHTRQHPTRDRNKSSARVKNGREILDSEPTMSKAAESYSKNHARLPEDRRAREKGVRDSHVKRSDVSASHHKGSPAEIGSFNSKYSQEELHMMAKVGYIATKNHNKLVSWLFKYHKDIWREYEKEEYDGRFRLEIG